MGYLGSVWGCHFQSLQFITRTTTFFHRTSLGTISPLIFSVKVYSAPSAHMVPGHDQGQVWPVFPGGAKPVWMRMSFIIYA